MKFSDIRLSNKLWAVILGLMISILAVGMWTQHTQVAAMEQSAANVSASDALIAKAIRWHGLTELTVERLLAMANSTDPAAGKFFGERVKDGIATISVLQADIVKDAASAADKEQLDRIGKARSLALAMTKKVNDVKATGDMVATRRTLNDEFLPVIPPYLQSLSDFIKLQESARDAQQVRAEAARQTASVWGIAATTAVFVAAIALVMTLVRSVTRPLAEAVNVANAIARGDLTQHVELGRKDEFGQLQHALSVMVKKLRGVIADVREGIDSVSTASSQIAVGNQDLSARTEQAAANLEETASSMEELTSTVTQSAETTRSANQLVIAAAEAARHGGSVVNEVTMSMLKIAEASKKIFDILGVIDGIAFQTNILALNAAVEAARAGEQGRGFAVVASEVRGLAQRSAQAAKEIKVLINASVETVQTGSQQVAQTGAAMNAIVTSVGRVTQLIADLTTTTTEQRNGIDQVNQAVSQLDSMTQQNAALVEESAAAATSLRDQANRLSLAISVFNVHGDSYSVA